MFLFYHKMEKHHCNIQSDLKYLAYYYPQCQSLFKRNPKMLNKNQMMIIHHPVSNLSCFDRHKVRGIYIFYIIMFSVQKIYP